LLYAVADVDGTISKSEKKEITKLVKRELMSLDGRKDNEGTDLPLYSKIEFEFLENEISDANAAFESFITFIENHQTAIDQRMLATIKLISNKLAGAYYGTNKKEKIPIEQLGKKIRSIDKERNKETRVTK